jgi:transcription elongation factor GreB
MFRGFFVCGLARQCYSGHFIHRAMSPANTAETDPDEDASSLPPLPAGVRNYITPAGYASLKTELFELIDTERPKVVDIVHWAASNGDRSENGDYIYGKKRLREIDRRIRFLTQRLELAEITDPSVHHGRDQIFFGATVVYLVDGHTERCVTIKGVDEADSAAGEISWVSPAARTLLKARVGDEVNLRTPHGVQVLEVLQVRYPAPD